MNHLNTRETYDGLPVTDYHGYGAIDFYAVDEHLGTLDQFRELVDKAHQAGIKIIQFPRRGSRPSRPEIYARAEHSATFRAFP